MDGEARSLAEAAQLELERSSGRLLGANRHYEKRLVDLNDIYSDDEEYSALCRSGAIDMCYFVDDFRTEGPESLVVGTSVLLPGTVGEEYLMTRGHLHEPVEAAEVYHCISGNGVLMLESISGQLTTVEMAPNRVIYIPGGLIHRSVNVGTTPLITLFLYRANVGQDYGVVEQAHGLSKLLVRDDAGWKLVTNSNYRARRVAQ